MPGNRASRGRHPRLARRAIRVAIGLWLVFGIVLWNALFDHAIVVAGRNYLYRQSQALRHNGPAVTIAGVMRPAAARGAIVASCWSLAVTAAGLAAVGYAASRVAGARDETAPGTGPATPPPDSRDS